MPRPRCPECGAVMNRLYIRIKKPGDPRPASKAPMSPRGYSCITCNKHFTDQAVALTESLP